MKQLRLRHGQIALVDDDVFEQASEFVWSLDSDGYVARWYRDPNRKLICTKLHYLALPRRRGFFTDHEDHDLLNNQRSNLRYATFQTNGRNRVKQKKPASSAYKGVCFSRKSGKWQACIAVNRINKWLGYFDSERAAAEAYNQEAVRLFGSFACVNRL